MIKCPNCGCENYDDYKFCKKCGASRSKEKISIDPFKENNTSKNKMKIDPIGDKSPVNGRFNKKTILIGLGIIAIIAIVAVAVNNLEIGGIEPGNESIININQDTDTVSGKYAYYISFTLINAAKNAQSYYAKVTWYDSNGDVILTKSESLEYYTINDDHTIDVYVQGLSDNKLNNISKCVIEITDNQGQFVTSADYNWISS